MYLTLAVVSLLNSHFTFCLHVIYVLDLCMLFNAQDALPYYAGSYAVYQSTSLEHVRKIT